MSDELIKELSRLQLLSSRYKNKMSMCPLSITFKEISKLYREILYNEYEKLEDYQKIYSYQILRDNIDKFKR